MKKILIIDEEEKLRSLLTRIISLEGFEVVQASDCRSGLKKLVQTDIDVVLCDVKLPDGSGVELAKAIKEKYPSTEIILLTAYGNIPDGVQDIKTEPLIISRKAMITAVLFHSCIRQVKKRIGQKGCTPGKAAGEKHSFTNIIGQSRTIRQAVELAKKVAGTDTTILLTGETGTGREVFAQAIHQESTRRTEHFVAINCSAFSRDVLEAKCSDIRPEPSQEPRKTARACLKRPIMAPFFWMNLARWLWTCRESCCELLSPANS